MKSPLLPPDEAAIPLFVSMLEDNPKADMRAVPYELFLCEHAKATQLLHEVALLTQRLKELKK